MIVEKRTYRIKPGSMHEFLRAYEEGGLQIQSQTLGNLLGYFSSEVGELNTVVQRWGFDSYEERVRRRAELSSKPEWRNFLGKAGAMVEHQENVLLTPASFSPIK